MLKIIIFVNVFILYDFKYKMYCYLIVFFGINYNVIYYLKFFCERKFKFLNRYFNLGVFVYIWNFLNKKFIIILFFLSKY